MSAGIPRLASRSSVWLCLGIGALAACSSSNNDLGEDGGTHDTGIPTGTGTGTGSGSDGGGLKSHDAGSGSGSSSTGSDSGTDAGSGSGSGTSMDSGSGSGSGSSTGSGSGSSTGSGSGSSTGTGSGTGSGSGSSLPGSLLTGGNDLTVYGVTLDGYVVYYNHTTSAIDVVSTAGGAPTLLSASPGSSFQIQIQNNVILAWVGLDDNQIGSLITWTAADGPHTISTASTPGYASVDQTSTYAIYATDVVASSTCNIVGSRTDGTLPETLTTAAASPPNMFIGIANNNAIVNAATSAGAQINSYVLGTWAGTPITTLNTLAFSGVQSFNTAGTQMLVIDPSNNLIVYPVTGGAGITVASSAGVIGDAGAAVVEGFTGLLTGAGTDVVYAGAGGTSFDVTAVVTPPVPTVLASGVDLSLYTLSPTGHTLVGYQGTTSNIVFGSATTNSALTTMAPALDFGGAVYTTDSSHILFVSNYDAATQIGQLSSFDVAAKTSAVIDAAIENVVTYGTSQAVFGDNVTASTADLKYFDTASAVAPKLIVAGAQPMWTLTGDASTKLIYSTSGVVGATAGIYITAVP
jgi:hypothetical protein